MSLESSIGRVDGSVNAKGDNRFQELYGIRIYDYTYDSKKADLQTLLISIGTKRAATVEKEINPLTTIVRARNEKLQKLGQALSVLTGIQTSFTDDNKPTDTKSLSDQLTRDMLDEISNESGFKDTPLYDQPSQTISKSQVEQAIQLVKTKMDKLNNDAQTDMTRMQSLVDKRDESFSTASQLMTSISDTFSTAIRNFA